jgi:hypothetical protein
VADRGNARVQAFDLDGRFVKSFGNGSLTSPSAFAVTGDVLVVAELRARLALFDGEDHLVEYVGDNEAVADAPGWPNSLDGAGDVVRSTRLEPHKFNSPHGVAVDGDGSLYVVEWLIGGRYTKLTRRRSR